jgi:hypothetical protein
VSINESSALHNGGNGGRPAALVLFRAISRRDWDSLQGWHKSCPGSTVEHLEHGLYVLTVPTGGAEEAAA